MSMAVTVLCLLLFFGGRRIFALFGITLDAFRIGAGALLFLSGVGLVQGKPVNAGVASGSELAVVPLAMPIIVGPATIGILMVMGAELEGVMARTVGCLALLAAAACITGVLLMGSFIYRRLGAMGIGILSRLTGLVLAALSAEMIMTGIQSYL